MKTIISTYSKKKVLYYATAIAILISAFACSPARESQTQNNISKDSIFIIPVNIDSKSIAIFSKDYKLLKEVKYHKDSNRFIYESYIRGYPKSDTLLGDFNGDDQQDTAWFNRSETLKYYVKNDECIGSFDFLNNKINSLELGDCCGGTFKNEGDLDGNGTDEIGVMYSNSTSGCRYYYVYTYTNNKWEFFIEAIESSYSMREAGIVLIEKDNQNNGYIIIRNILYFTKDSMPLKYIEQGGGSCSWSNVIEQRIKVHPSFKHNNN